MTLPPRPDGPLRVILDTDTANEIDDQFAIAWALLSPERLVVEAVHAAPFCHGHYFEAVFVAGYPSASPHADDSLNLVQDRHASNVLFESGVPLLYQPGYHVAEVLGLSLPDCERWVQGHGPLGDLLHDIYVQNPIDADVHRVGRSWVMWDMVTIAWLLDPAWAPTFETARARVDDAHTWQSIDGRMLETYRVEGNEVFADFLEKLHARA